ncbi:MAG: hypothetical protein RQ899_11915 [Pseudomonadales bacterium]|nr:hypothetical protein [Pseudomonadales bacterium]
MSCDHQLITDYLDAYIKGTLDPVLRKKCDEALLQCGRCHECHARALEFCHLSGQWEEQDVPSWHRVRYAVKPRQQYNWLSWTALATSCLTLVLVVGKVEVSADRGLMISFGGQQSEARVQARVAQQLEMFRTVEKQVLETRFADFSQKQNSANLLLLADWQNRNRQERRQDMEFLMTSWERQRFQDRRQTDERLSYLAQNQIDSDQYLNELLRTADNR